MLKEDHVQKVRGVLRYVGYLTHDQTHEKLYAEVERIVAQAYDDGFQEGETKRAIIEIQGRELFLKSLPPNKAVKSDGVRD